MSTPGRANIQGLWIGGNGQPANVSEATPFQPGQLGKVAWLPGGSKNEAIAYQYVYRTTDATAAADGSIAYWADLDDFQVTNIATSAIGGVTTPLVAGAFLGANPASGSYGFIQVTGEKDGVACTGTAVVGQPLCEAGQNLLTARGTQAADLPQVAICVEAFESATGTTFKVLLDGFRNGW